MRRPRRKAADKRAGAGGAQAPLCHEDGNILHTMPINSGYAVQIACGMLLETDGVRDYVDFGMTFTDNGNMYFTMR